MKLKRRVLQASFLQGKAKGVKKVPCAWYAIFKMLFGKLIGSRGCNRLRLGERLVVQFVEHDALAADVGEEILALAQRRVHLTPRVRDKAGRRLDAPVADEPVLGLVPVGEVGKLAVVDDDQQVVVRSVAL